MVQAYHIRCNYMAYDILKCMQYDIDHSSRERERQPVQPRPDRLPSDNDLKGLIPRASLFALGAGTRLTAAAILVSLLWGLVLWAQGD